MTDRSGQHPLDWDADERRRQTRRITLAQQINEVLYELEQRRKVYPRLAAAHHRRQSELDYHEDAMRAVLQTLQWLQANEAIVREVHIREAKARAAVPASPSTGEVGAPAPAQTEPTP